MIASPSWGRRPACHRFHRERPARGTFFFILLLLPFLALRAADPQLTISSPQTGTLPADYTTSKLFLDEIESESIPLDIVFTPADPESTDVQIWTNLNRRDRADEDADGDGTDDGISPPDANRIEAGDDAHYFKAYPMARTRDGSWHLTIPAQKTGAYRLTARWKIPGDPHWHWFTDLHRRKRDHAVTVTPREARDIRLYEINVLSVEASGDTFAQRSTLEDLHNATGARHNGSDRWSLDHLRALGANWLWFQPIHPSAGEGREPSGGWDTDSAPYQPGSPYAVRNFFEVSPAFSVKNTRAAAMQAWQDFAAVADAKDIGLMLDAPFNHTAFDVELGRAGLALFQPDGEIWQPADLIRDRLPAFFSNAENYGTRATTAEDIGPSPDRADFGKWRDVKDVFFGRYDALVETPAEPELMSHRNEGDWFDLSGGEWNATDFTQNGRPRNTTRLVWKYFAQYALHWLDTTRPPGQNRNSSTEPGLTTEQRRHWDAAGIDGLRCDFGQGLPPQAWEYISNTARERKWNFVMMSESLDGGPVTFRSNRHFDVLNESIVFPLKSATTASDYRKIFEDRRNAFGPALVLLNTVSHDEENYEDPWEAVIRYSACAAMDGVPMIFPGQELGIRKDWGYDHYEQNFGKTIPHFKRHNSMQPVWGDQDFLNDQLFQVFAAINHARAANSALRSPNRWFLDTGNEKIFGVAKRDRGLPVLAFANLDRANAQRAEVKIPAEIFHQLGLREDGLYQARNLAAYENPSLPLTGRRTADQWGRGLSGARLKNQGLPVSLHPVPPTPEAWKSAPFEPLYLELRDITPTPVEISQSSLVGEGIALFTPAGFDPSRTPRFALQREPRSHRFLPARWPLKPEFFQTPAGSSARLAVPPGTSLYGTGEVLGPLRRNGQTIELWNSDNLRYEGFGGRRLYQSHPWVLGVRPDGTAFGVLFDSTWKATLHTGDTEIVFDTEGAPFRIAVVDRDSPQAVLRGLAELTGTIPLPPRWALGFHQSRYSYHPDAQVREIATGFRQRRLPCDVIWMDIHHMRDYRVFTFDPATFPDPSATNDFLHSLKFKAVWMVDPGVKIDPGYSVFDTGTAKDVWVQTADGKTYEGDVWPGPSVFPDFTMPTAQKWWRDLYRGFVAHGIDGVWNDMNEPTVFNTPDLTLPEDAHHRGGGNLPPGPHRLYHNVYGLLMVKATREALRTAAPDKRPFVLTRANFLGGHRYAATWTGDNLATMEHLELSIPMGLNLGLSGQPLSGPDIGGYWGPVDAATYAQWIALGVFHPFARAHTERQNPPREPWSFGDDVEKTARTALERRYRLLPYLYTLAHEAHTTGLPIMRPLFFANPADPKLRDEQASFLLGDDLLVIPKWAKNPAHPDGAWREATLFHDQREKVGCHPTLKVRPGAILPLGRIIQHTGENSLDPLTLIVNPDASGQATGTLYDDAGDGFANQAGDFFLATFQARQEGGKVRVTVTKKTGSRPLPEKTILIVLADNARPLRATGNISEGLLAE